MTSLVLSILVCIPIYCIVQKQRGLNRLVGQVFKNLYARLCVVVKVPTRHGHVMSKIVIRVWKRIHQAGETSSPLYDNSVVAPQRKARISFVFKHVVVTNCSKERPGSIVNETLKTGILMLKDT